MPKTWFTITAAAGSEAPEILIYDYIGSYGVNAKDFDKELKALGVVRELTLRINSSGGETPTAASIYNMLARWKERTKAKVTVIIDGVALSSASWLAMLGDEVIMPENTLMMIHNPSGYASGTAKEMRALAEVLDKVKSGMALAYERKSGKDPEAISLIMDTETWYTAQEAVDEGFADKVEGSVDTMAYADIDLKDFKNPPATLVGDASSRTAANTKEDPPMLEKTPKTETPAEMEARIRAEVTASLAPQTQQQIAAPVVATAVETPAAMEARIRAQVAEEANIRAYCAQVGHSDKADKFIEDGKSLSEVFTAISSLAPADQPNGRLSPTAAHLPNARNHGYQQTQQQVEDKLEVPKLDPVAIWTAWNKPKARTAA